MFIRRPGTTPLPPIAGPLLGLLVGLLGFEAACAQNEAPIDPSDPVAGRQHWAFQPLAPESRSANPAHRPWSRSSIDEAIASSLHDAGIQPVVDATRPILLRRLYFHLIGLPPSAQAVREFVSDARSDATERVVDALLNSPRFGERWGRHWLDLARYADSNGLDENFLFREAWRYRNWVIGALNQDLPFDRFVLEQMAGDLLPFDSIEQRDRQRIAAGFLVVGPKVLLGSNPNNQRMEVADEQLDTIGRTFLGLTLGCARCHDHKFEPIPTADYYAMAGILTSTQVMERRHMLGQQRVMERLVGLGSDGDSDQAAYETFWRQRNNKTKTLSAAKAALTQLEKEKPTSEEDLEAFVKKHGQALAEKAKELSIALPERLKIQRAFVDELAQYLAKPPGIPPRAMIPADREDPADEAIRISGQFDKLGEKVPRGTLQVISARPLPEIQDGSSGRVELGQWLTDVDHGAGRLTARVMANRIWYHLIGRGLVRTVDNFGRTGEAPSHPALLDHLATELIASGWSIKSLVRQIVLSRAFALSSAHQEHAHAIDPENRLVWRAHRRRLDPEALRDAMLRAADTLDLAWTDSTVNYLGDQATAVGKNENRRRTDFPCRSVYLPVIRNDLPELFEVFDFADPHATTGARPKTTAASQGLFLLNDTMVMDTAEAMVHRLERLHPEADPWTRLDILLEWALSEVPTAKERQNFIEFIEQTSKQLKEEGREKDPDQRAWALAAHAMFSLSRFQFLE